MGIVSVLLAVSLSASGSWTLPDGSSATLTLVRPGLNKAWSPNGKTVPNVEVLKVLPYGLSQDKDDLILLVSIKPKQIDSNPPSARFKLPFGARLLSGFTQASRPGQAMLCGAIVQSAQVGTTDLSFGIACGPWKTAGSVNLASQNGIAKLHTSGISLNPKVSNFAFPHSGITHRSPVTKIEYEVPKQFSAYDVRLVVVDDLGRIKLSGSSLAPNDPKVGRAVSTFEGDYKKVRRLELQVRHFIWIKSPQTHFKPN